MGNLFKDAGHGAWERDMGIGLVFPFLFVKVCGCSGSACVVCNL
jgi:hypothetical protein